MFSLTTLYRIDSYFCRPYNITTRLALESDLMLLSLTIVTASTCSLLEAQNSIHPDPLCAALIDWYMLERRSTSQFYRLYQRYGEMYLSFDERLESLHQCGEGCTLWSKSGL
jgi:hypothetical protein